MQTHSINFIDTPEPQFEPKPKRKRWVFFSVLLIICLFLGAGYISANREQILGPLEYDPVTLEPKAPKSLFKKLTYFVFGRDARLEGVKDDRINVLLLGMGGPGHDGPYLTDTIMIVSIKPSTKQVALISIPRDLAIDVPGKGIRKINHVNAYGEQDNENWGGAFATEVISKQFNVEIPYYIRVDFKAVEEIIDEMGGVTVDVDRSFVDYMYPAQGDLYQTLSFTAGQQTMDGATALQFARSRHGNNGEGSDFARAHRQQKIILAAKEKLMSFGTLSNPVRIKHMMDALEKHMTTNMEFDEILSLVKMAREFNTGEIKTLVLDNSENGFLRNTVGVDGAFLLEPRTGNFNDINLAIGGIFENTQFTQKDTTPPQAPPSYTSATVEIQNGTWNAGLAARVKQKLQSDNFYIHSIGNTDPAFKPITIGGIYKISDKSCEDIMLALQQKLNLSIRETPPEGLIPTTSTDILVVLGDDFIEQ